MNNSSCYDCKHWLPSYYNPYYYGKCTNIMIYKIEIRVMGITNPIWVSALEGHSKIHIMTKAWFDCEKYFEPRGKKATSFSYFKPREIPPSFDIWVASEWLKCSK